MSTNDITVAVSACLLGQPVRYDGNHKFNKTISETFGSLFRLIPVCPEISCGMGVPRPKIKLTKRDGRIHLANVNDPKLDFSNDMIRCANEFLEQNPAVSGLILQDKSPSCGLGNTPIFNATGGIITYGHGLFTLTLINHIPDLPVIGAKAINCKTNQRQFINQVVQYHQLG